MDTPNERAERTLSLAQSILKAGEAMEKEDWLECQKLCGEAARMSRVLHLIDKQASAEGSD